MSDKTGESKSSQDNLGNGENAEESILDKVVGGGIKRGLETLIRERGMKNVLQDLKLPKEIVAHILSQVDDTKRAALGVVGKEIRLFLERTNLSEELAKLLALISFEVTTQVRFVPRDNTCKGGEKRAAKPKRASRKASPRKPDLDPPANH